VGRGMCVDDRKGPRKGGALVRDERWLVCGPARGARRRGRRAAGTSAGAREGSMKRLLIRAPNWIGDAVMSEPAIRHFRATYPDARVTVLARPAIAELLAAHPAIDERIVYDPRRYMGLSGK